MSLVDAPLARDDVSAARPSEPTVRAMAIGQHLIAVALTVIGVIRALGDGVAAPAAIIAGVAILAWHTAGALIPRRAAAASARARTEASAPASSVTWWLVGFAAVWIAAVAVSPEFVWLAFLGSAWACRDGAHMSVSMVYDMFPKPVRAVLYALIQAVTVAFFIALGYCGYAEILDEIALNAMTETLVIPVWWFTSSIPIGSALIVLRTLQRTFEDFAHGTY